MFYNFFIILTIFWTICTFSCTPNAFLPQGFSIFVSWTSQAFSPNFLGLFSKLQSNLLKYYLHIPNWNTEKHEWVFLGVTSPDHPTWNCNPHHLWSLFPDLFFIIHINTWQYITYLLIHCLVLPYPSAFSCFNCS